MIDFKEFSVLVQKTKLNLKTKDLIIFHKSVAQGLSSYWHPKPDKNKLIQLFYSDSWLKTELSIVRKEILTWNKKHQIHILSLDQPEYPKTLFKLTNPPPHLFIMGDFIESDHSLAIVGRREAKPYTLKWMEDQLGLTLLKQRPLVISGGARGVDSKAHQCALMNNCKTIYVMPSGLLNLYPGALQKDYTSLIKSGATFISTYLPEDPMRKQNFSDRNWIIAALTQKILILEAEIRSGSYKTAKYAIELGLDLGVVPSFPTDPTYSGSLQLLYEGASLIRDHQDLSVFLNFNENESLI